MTTTTQNYGTKQTLTITALHGIADGVYWQSAKIDNETEKALSVELFITIHTSTSTAADDLGKLEAFIANSVDGGTDFAGGASGSEGTFTNSGNNNVEHMKRVDAFPCDNSESTERTYRYHATVYDISEDFAIVIGNNSGLGL